MRGGLAALRAAASRFSVLRRAMAHAVRRVRARASVQVRPRYARAMRAWALASAMTARWTRERLAKEAGLAERTIANFERGARDPHDNNKAAMRAALERGGVR